MMNSTLFQIETRLRYSKYAISFLFVHKLHWSIFMYICCYIVISNFMAYLLKIYDNWPKIVNEQKHEKARSSLPKINQAESI